MFHALRSNCCSRFLAGIIWLLAPTVLAGWQGPAEAAAEAVVLVVCAPGYPGSTAEAQPTLDAFAAAVGAAASWPVGELTAVYHESEAGGAQALENGNAGLALVTLPFFVAHHQDLGLEPVAQAVAVDGEAAEPWALVAGVGRVRQPADLAGWELVSLAAFSSQFVRGPALGGWGKLPADATLSFSGAVLSGLRKAARGQNVAMLLDGPQTRALPGLPFAEQLEVVYQSPALPVALLCRVRDRISETRATQLVSALRSLDADPEGGEVLAGLRLRGFVAADQAAVDAALAAAP